MLSFGGNVTKNITQASKYFSYEQRKFTYNGIWTIVTVTTLCYGSMKTSLHRFNYILAQQPNHGGITVKHGI